MAKRRLKAWDDPTWKRKLSRTLTISRVDEDIPTAKQPAVRKPWSIALTQKPDELARAGGVDGLPEGQTLLLSEQDVLELVRYLFEPQTAVWSSNPSPTKPGEVEFVRYTQPGLIGITESGEILNGEAHWSPEYFRRLAPARRVSTRKVHTLPWKLPKG
jgi:hypothetical protein